MYYIGVDVGGMSIKLGIVDENGNIIAHEKLITSKEDSQEVHAIQIGEKFAYLTQERSINLTIDSILNTGK